MWTRWADFWGNYLWLVVSSVAFFSGRQRKTWIICYVVVTLRAWYGTAFSKCLVLCWLLREVLVVWLRSPASLHLLGRKVAFFGELGCVPFCGCFGEKNNIVFKELERDLSDVWSLVKFYVSLWAWNSKTSYSGNILVIWTWTSLLWGVGLVFCMPLDILQFFSNESCDFY